MSKELTLTSEQKVAVENWLTSYQKFGQARADILARIDKRLTDNDQEFSPRECADLIEDLVNLRLQLAKERLVFPISLESGKTFTVSDTKIDKNFLTISSQAVLINKLEKDVNRLRIALEEKTSSAQRNAELGEGMQESTQANKFGISLIFKTLQDINLFKIISEGLLNAKKHFKPEGQKRFSLIRQSSLANHTSAENQKPSMKIEEPQHKSKVTLTFDFENKEDCKSLLEEFFRKLPDTDSLNIKLKENGSDKHLKILHETTKELVEKYKGNEHLAPHKNASLYLEKILDQTKIELESIAKPEKSNDKGIGLHRNSPEHRKN